MSDREQPGDFIIHVRPLPDAAPTYARMRRLLKMMLRGFGFRCQSVREVTAKKEEESDSQKQERPSP